MTLKVLDFPEPGEGQGPKNVDARLEQLVEYAKQHRPVAMFCVLLTDNDCEHVSSFVYKDVQGAELLGVVELAKLRLAREVEVSLEDEE